MNNLNLNDKRVRDALITLLNNEEFDECDIATDYLGIEWVEENEILIAPITNKNFEKELQDWRVSAVIHFGNYFTWAATGAAEWNKRMVLAYNIATFERLLELLKEAEEETCDGGDHCENCKCCEICNHPFDLEEKCCCN